MSFFYYWPIGMLLITQSLAAAETAKVLTIQRTIPHSGYSEGLDYFDSHLWNSLPKQLVKIDPKDGTVVARFEAPTEHSESIKWVKNKMIHVSFANNGIFEGTVKDGKFDFRKVGTTPEDRAWGLEFDGVNFILTGNYSSKLYWISAKSWKLVRTVHTKMKDIEDLAWDGKYLWSSSFTEWRGHIFRIDPKTGEIGPFYRLPNPEACPIIDGLAFDGKGLWITGKECPALFYSEMPK